MNLPHLQYNFTKQIAPVVTKKKKIRLPGISIIYRFYEILKKPF